MKDKVIDYFDLADMIDEKYQIKNRDYLGTFDSATGVYDPTKEYCDYWHFLLDDAAQWQIRDGITLTMDLAEIREIAVKTDILYEDNEVGKTGWRTQVTDLFIREIGVGPKEFYFSW